MYQVLKKNWDKSKYLILSGIFIASILLLTVVYKSDEKIIKKSMTIGISYENPDLKTFKEFLLNQIKSPFTNFNYEIKRGDTIQKILKKLEVQNNEIQNIINQYKKYGNPNQLLAGNEIDIIIKKNLSANKNTIEKFSVPITKSTTIAITKDEDNKITSNKIITKLYKKKILSENIIKKIYMHLQWKLILTQTQLLNSQESLVSKLIFKGIYEKTIILKLFMKNILMKMVNL